MCSLKIILKKVLHKLMRTAVFSPVYVFFTLCRDSNISILKYITARERNYLFMVAMHNNGGDLAQTVCIDEWIYKNYPSGIVVNVAWTSPDDKILERICDHVRVQDNVFIHSGYNITDIGGDYAAPTVFPSHKIILETLRDHRIIFFPQTVEYKSIDKWKYIRDMYNKHPDIVFLSRDRVSLDYARVLLPHAVHLAYPDIVTTWIGKYDFPKPEKDIFLCLRYGAESLLTEEKRCWLENRLSALGALDRGDTDVSATAFQYRGHRKQVVLNMISEFAKYKIVVTDRYHGVIFSLIAGRPVIVLKTAGHKVQSAIDWFPDSFRDYVLFVDDPDNIDYIVNMSAELLGRNMPALKSTYFNDEVYGGLLKKINSVKGSKVYDCQ